MSRRLFSSGWPLPSDSDGFIMINKFHFHREKRDHVSSNWKQGGFFSNANFWTPPCVTLQFRHKVIREDVDSSTTLTTAMPGTSATLRPQRWLRKEERQVPWTPNGVMGKCVVTAILCMICAHCHFYPTRPWPRWTTVHQVMTLCFPTAQMKS